MPANPFQSGPGGTAMGTSGPDDDRSMIDGPKIPLSELFSLVRHSKFTLIKEAIDYLPNKTFDKSLVQVRRFISFILKLTCSVYFLLFFYACLSKPIHAYLKINQYLLWILVLPCNPF